MVRIIFIFWNECFIVHQKQNLPLNFGIKGEWVLVLWLQEVQILFEFTRAFRVWTLPTAFYFDIFKKVLALAFCPLKALVTLSAHLIFGLNELGGNKCACHYYSNSILRIDKESVVFLASSVDIDKRHNEALHWHQIYQVLKLLKELAELKALSSEQSIKMIFGLAWISSFERWSL